MKKIIYLVTWTALPVLFMCLIFSSGFSKLFASVNLTIVAQGSNSVTVAWPGTGLYILQTNNNLGPANWGAYGGLIGSNNGTDSVMIQPLTSGEFFRLENTGGLISPTNISGMAYYWNYNDLPVNQEINAWTDEIQGLVLAYNNGGTGNDVSPQTTSVFPGLNIPTYGDYIAFTGNLALFSSNFTFWVVMRPSIENDSANEAIFGNGNAQGINVSANVLSANWGGGAIYSSMVMNYTNTQAFPYGQTYDILDSGGALYSNGVAMAVGIGQPTNSFPFSAIGARTTGNGFSAEGYIQYLGIWTNHLLTATDATNLDNWYWNYGVTNITNGLIAWWKFNDGSGTTAADSAGTNTMFFGGTGNLWTNSSMVYSNGLYFSGSGWTTNLNPGLADNLPAMTISFWLKETGLGGNNTTGSLIEKGADTGYFAGDPGWAVQGDGVSNIYLGSYQTGGNYIETPHNSAAPDYPIVGDNRWHFITGEYTNPPGGSMSPVIYIDGAQITGGVVTTGNVTNFSVLNSPIFIGAENTGGTITGSPSGILSDVRIYNRELSLPEINDLYKWRGEP